MHRLAVALCVFSAISSHHLAGSTIGFATCSGSFRVDTHQVEGHATLFEGATLETMAYDSEVELTRASRVALAAASRGRVFRDHFLLERGRAEMEGSPNYSFEALGLRLTPVGPHAGVRVALVGDGKLQALALDGALRVSVADGTVVAILKPGRALEFQPQKETGAQVPFEMTGCVERRDGRFLLRDPLTGVVEEIRGTGLAQQVGRMVEVTAVALEGEKPLEGAQEVVFVRRLRRVAGSCPAPEAAGAVPAKPGAVPPAAPPAPQPGMSAGAKAAIAGVVIGGAGAGAVVYWKIKQNEQKGTISR